MPITIRRSRFRRLPWTAVALFIALACSKGDDFQAISKLIDKARELGEKHDIGELMNLATGDFTASPGDLDSRSTRAVLWRAFRYYGKFRIHHPSPGVDLEPGGERASASLPFLIVREDVSFPKLKELARDPKRWLEEVGESADPYWLDIELVKDKGRWLVHRAHVRAFTGRSFRE